MVERPPQPTREFSGWAKGEKDMSSQLWGLHSAGTALLSWARIAALGVTGLMRGLFS